jgi:hypothetical protein
LRLLEPILKQWPYWNTVLTGRELAVLAKTQCDWGKGFQLAVTIFKKVTFFFFGEKGGTIFGHQSCNDLDMAPSAKSTKRKQLTAHSSERPSKKAHKQKEVEEVVEEEQEFEDTEMADEYEGEEEEEVVGEEQDDEDAKPKQSRSFTQSMISVILGY